MNPDSLLEVYKRTSFTLDRGEGMYVWDTAGKRYLDFASGIAVMALGHSHPAVVRAIQEQAAKLAHVSNLYPTEPMLKFAAVLTEHSFANKVFFCNSGTEANEAALKFARKVALKEPGRKKVVSFIHGFHGRTMGALSITEKAKIREPFAPLVPNVEFIEFNSMAALSAIDTTTAVVFLEPIQGEGGIIPATREFLATVRKKCDETGAVLVFDEVQCGLGRTGTLWAYQMSGVIPDIMTLAKPLGGGLPCGAVLMNERVANAMEAGDHGSTFGANPVVAAAGMAVIQEVLKPGFLAHVQSKGAVLREKLKSLQSQFPVLITDVRGAGLMLGIEFNEPVLPFIQRLMELGVLTIASGDTVMRLLPPLIVNEEQIESFTQSLRTALMERMARA